MTDTARIIKDCIGLLQQATALIGRTEEREYDALLPVSPRGSIAGHLRHVLEFYQCFLAGYITGAVDYNQRPRDLLIERDRNYASGQIAKVIIRLREISLADGDVSLAVALEGATGPVASRSRSSVLRELDFLQSHTVHHYALIAILLRLQGVEPGAEFGVAPSTLEYWARESVCAA